MGKYGRKRESEHNTETRQSLAGLDTNVSERSELTQVSLTKE